MSLLLWIVSALTEARSIELCRASCAPLADSGAIRFEDIFRMVPGARIRPNGMGYVVELQRDPSNSSTCPPAYFVDGVYFPITVREFGASVEYRDLSEGAFDVGGLRLRTMLLSHPGNCLGYRLEASGRAFSVALASIAIESATGFRPSGCR